MNSAYIVSGMMFGDEGKGSVTDYLASKIDAKSNVRYYGGSQAAHSVKNGNVFHRFSQLGSSFMNSEVNTFLSSNTVVNPFNIITEADIYSRESSSSIRKVLSRIFIDKDSKVVTPYHSLITKLNELDRVEKWGITGSGVSEVNRIYEKLGICITISDLLKMDSEIISKFYELHTYTKSLYEKLYSKKELIRYVELNDEMISDRNYLLNCYRNLIDSNLLNITDFKSFYKGGNVLFEGSQGVMLDKDYGIKPHVTSCDTTNRFAYKLASDINIKPTSIGCVSVYTSRHGAGPLSTNSDYLNSIIFDENQVISYFQGKPRYGWLDLVLLRYALKINKIDELFLTMIDRFSNIKKINICNSYIYTGKIDDEFYDTFEFYIDNKNIVITDIKLNNNLKYYLSNIIPIYEKIDGYTFDNKSINNINDFPDEIFKYINYIEEKTYKKVKYLSYGPDRKQKMRMDL